MSQIQATDVVVGTMFTFTGKRFKPLEPDPDLICIEDIAHALSNISRYGGHCHRFFSVADHSIRVAERTSDKNEIWSLLHDAPEAYLGDIPAPLKQTGEFSFYNIAEKTLMDAICEKWNLPKEEPEEVKYWDLTIRATEMRDITSIPKEFWNGNDIIKPLDERINPMSSDNAEIAFLTYAYSLGIE